MVPEKTKELLLALAEEVENDPHYSGAGWLPTGNSCGCAMIRILRKGGAEVREYPSYTPFGSFGGFKLSGFADSDFDSDYDKTEGYDYNVPQAVAYLTGISDEVWNDFTDYSVSANRFETAQALRKLAETGDYH